MKAFITGATGYIGHELAMELANRNFVVHALVRDLNSEKIPYHSNIILYKGDICDPKSIQKAVMGCDYVFHTAAYTDLKCNKIDSFYQTNVIGTSNVLKASFEEKVKKFIHTSTLSVYGPALRNVPISEEQPRLESYSNDYELTKKMAEEEVLKFVNKGLNCTILNVSRVYGPGLKTFSNGVNRIISKIMKDKTLIVPAKLDVEANYVYIDDVVNAELLAIENDLSGEKYIIGGENINYEQLFSKVKALSKSNISIIKINYNIFKNIIGGITRINTLLNLNLPITQQVVESLFTNRTATSEKAISSLNYKITPLNSGIARTIKSLN